MNVRPRVRLGDLFRADGHLYRVADEHGKIMLVVVEPDPQFIDGEVVTDADAGRERAMLTTDVEREVGMHFAAYRLLFDRLRDKVDS